MPEWNGKPEPPPIKTSGKYISEEPRTDWSQVNGTIPVRSNRSKPEPEDWHNDSTGSEWNKRSFETDYKESPRGGEWNKDIPIIKETPAHARNSWVDDVPPVIERLPPEHGKAKDRWNGHPANADVDRWNSQPVETPVQPNDRWNGSKLEPVKISERRNSHVLPPIKNGTQWNDHAAEVKMNDRYNMTEPLNNEDRWIGHTPVEPIKNAEHWKSHAVESIKNGWSEETVVEEWSEEPMTNHQIDSVISKWQDDNERNEWLPAEESFDKEDIPQPEFPEIREEELPEDDLGPENDLVYKSPHRDSVVTHRESEYENSLTVTNKETDIVRDRRPSVMSNKGVLPSLDLSEMNSEMIMPRNDVPELTIDDGDPTISRAKR
ncbi:hypothetical protein X975_00569, partial [Stegodyphus mimosarum]